MGQGRSTPSAGGWAVTAFAPLIFVAMMLGLVAGAKPTDTAVRGAIVNLDVGDPGRGSKVGREVAAGLASDPHTALVWEEVGQQEAGIGVDKGTYQVAVVIPPDFSADLAQMAADPIGAPRASVDIATTTEKSINALAIGHEVARALNDVIAERVVAGSLSRVSIHFSTLQSSMTHAAAEAAKLTQQTAGAQGDVERAQAEARRLVDEMADARDDAGRIAQAQLDMATRLAQAARDADDNAAAVGTVADASRLLADRADDVVTGADEVADRAARQVEQASDALGAARTMNSVAHEAHDRAVGAVRAFGYTAAELNGFLDAIDDALQSAPTVNVASVSTLATVLRDHATRVGETGDLNELSAALESEGDQLDGITDEMTQIRASANAPVQVAQCPKRWSDEFCRGYVAGAARLSELVGGIDSVLGRLDDVRSRFDEASRGLDDASARREALSAELTGLADELDQVVIPDPSSASNPAPPSADAMADVARRTAHLRDDIARSGADLTALVCTLASLQERADAVVDAATQAEAGARQTALDVETLRSDVSSFAGDVDALSRRLDELSAAAMAHRADDPSSREAARAGALSSLIAQAGGAASPALAQTLARALVQSEDRSARLADALDDAAHDLGQAQGSTGRIRAAIAIGSVPAPAFLAPDNAGEVADALRAPVVLDEPLPPMAPDGRPIPRQVPAPVAPLLGMALAIIALAVIMWRPRRLPGQSAEQERVPRGYASSQPPVFIVAAATGAGCGLIAMALGFIGWSAALPVTVLMTLAGVVMAAVADALGGWLGRAGIFVVVAWMALLSARLSRELGGHDHVSWLGALSPLTALTDGIRRAIASEPTTTPVLTLLGWLAAAVVLGVWARYRNGLVRTRPRSATR